MKVKALKFTKNYGFHGISQKWAFFTEECQFHGKCHGREIVKLWIRLVPSHATRNNCPLCYHVALCTLSCGCSVIFHTVMLTGLQL